MTREEAIAYGKECLSWNQFSKDMKMYQFIEMAIKALSQEPTDAISRDAAITIAGTHTLTVDETVKALEQLPSVTPKPIECDDAIDREELLKAIDTWDKFGVDDTNSLFRLDNLSLPYYVPYIHYDDVIKCIKGMPSVTQNPKYWIDKDNKLYKMPDDIPTMTIQYPTITHGDTISRTEVMKVISDFVTFEKYIDKHNHITFEPLEKLINSLPSVTQKSGKWIRVTDKAGHLVWECDKCGWQQRFNTNFCPDCGAKMVEPQESEE